MNVELMDCTRVLLDEIAAPEFTRDDVALTYALAILSSYPTDWPRINEAIVERWSKSALLYIKERARKHVSEKRKA